MFLRGVKSQGWWWKQLDVFYSKCIVQPSKYMKKVKYLFFSRDKKVHFLGPRDIFWEILGDECLVTVLRKVSPRQIYRKPLSRLLPLLMTIKFFCLEELMLLLSTLCCYNMSILSLTVFLKNVLLFQCRSFTE